MIKKKKKKKKIAKDTNETAKEMYKLRKKCRQWESENNVLVKIW